MKSRVLIPVLLGLGLLLILGGSMGRLSNTALAQSSPRSRLRSAIAMSGLGDVERQTAKHYIPLALNAPQIEVQPASYDETLDWEAVQSQALTISNTSSEIMWFSIRDLASPDAQIGVVGQDTNSWVTELNDDLELSDRFTFVSLGDNWTYTALQSYDGILVSEGDHSLTTDETAALRQYYDVGGPILLGMDDIDSQGATEQADLYYIFGVTNAQDGEFVVGDLNIAHPIAQGVTLWNVGLDNDHFDEGGATWVVRGDDGNDYVLAHDAAIRSVIFGERLSEWWDSGNQQLVRNAIQWAIQFDVPWLSEEPLSGTLPAYSATPVTITFDASQVNWPGGYQARLWVSSNDPYTLAVRVPVTMTVNPGPDWGQLKGAVTSDRPGGPMEGARVDVISGATTLASGVTDAAGLYGPWWLEAGDYTVTVAATDYVTASAAVTITAQATTTQDLVLRWRKPEMRVSPLAISAALRIGVSAILPISISNSGAADLDFELREDVPWLFEDPVSGTVAPEGGLALITVTLDAASVNQPGEYLATLNVHSNDPISDQVSIPATMTVELGDNMGKLEGAVYSQGHCDVNIAALEGAQVRIEGNYLGTGWVTLTTGISGTYSYWLEAGVYTVTAFHPTHLIATSTVDITAQDPTTQDLVLRWLWPCIHVTPPDISDTLDIDARMTIPVGISNSGAGALNFELWERERGFQVAPTLMTGPLADVSAWASTEYRGLMTNDALDQWSPARANAPLAPGSVIQSWSSGQASAWGIAFAYNRVWLNSGWGSDSVTVEYLPDGMPTERSWPHTWNPLNGPADSAFNWNSGMIWTLDVEGENCLHELDPASGYTGETICGPWTASQQGVAYDPDTATWYVGGWDDNTIYHIDSSGALLDSDFVDLDIAGLAYNPETQHLFVQIDGDSNDVYVLDASLPGMYPQLGHFHVGAWASGAGLEIDCDGNLWAVDQGNGMVYQVESGESASLCHQDAPWLFQEPISGTVAPDGGLAWITVTLDSAYVAQPGDYWADLWIASNDPHTPTLSIPVTMTVEPDPLSMGALSGTVTSDRPGDPLTGALVEVFLGDAFIVSYTTTISGSYGPMWMRAGDYKVAVSADGYVTEEQEITVLAQQVTLHDITLALNAPQLELAAVSYEERLDWGHKQIRQWTISNTGPALMSFSVQDSTGASAQIGVVGYYASNLTTILNADPELSRRYTFVNLGSSWTYATIQDYDGILVNEDDSTYYLTPGETAALRQYYDAGGPILLGKDDIDDEGAAEQDDLYYIFGVTNAQDGSFYVGTLHTTHPIAQGVTLASIGGDNDHFDADGATWVVRGDDGNDYVLARDGIPRAVIFGDTLSHWWSTGNQQLVRNAINWAIQSDAPWLSEEPISGTLPAYSTTLVTVTFDAARVAQPGVYRASLFVLSNDPFTPAVSIPANMTVEFGSNTGVLQGRVRSDQSGNFLKDALVEVVSGDAVIVPHTTDDYGSYGPQLLWAGVNTVTVSADGHVTFVESVDISAGMTTTYDVTLAVYAPQGEVRPAALDEALDWLETRFYTLTIANTGPAPLEFEIAEHKAVSDILLMGNDVDIAGWDAYRDALREAGWTWDEWVLNVSSFPTANDLAPFEILIWFDESELDSSDVECQIVADWLLSGGKSLFVSSVDFLRDLHDDAPGKGKHNLYLLFNTGYVDDSAGTGISVLEGVFNDSIGHSFAPPASLSLSRSSESSGDYAEGPTRASAGLLYGSGGSGSTYSALTHHQGANYKTVWLGVNFHNGLTSQVERSQLMGNILDFFVPGDDLAWLSVDPVTGTVPALSSAPVTITFDAIQVAQLGVYRGNLSVTSNDRYHPRVSLPVRMTVGSFTALNIAKTGAPDLVRPGEFLVYTIAAQNTGSANATGVMLTDTIPDNTEFIWASSSGSLMGPQMHWTGRTIPAGDSLTMTLIVRVNSSLSNSLIITNADYGVTCAEGARASGSPVSTVVIPDNRPPYIPGNPVPGDGALQVPFTQTLYWQGGDPDNDPVTYTIALGVSNPPPIVATGINTTSYSLGTLILQTTYHWIVTATDGISTSVGPMWSFTTEVPPQFTIYLPLVLRYYTERK